MRRRIAATDLRQAPIGELPLRRRDLSVPRSARADGALLLRAVPKGVRGECATNADAAEGSFRLRTGKDLLREFESSPGQLRVFCGRCGSPVFKRYVDDPGRIRIRLGLLDDDFDETPGLQVFTSEKLRLTRIDESIPSFERSVPPRAG